jgi:type I restriction enzyme S subunit
MKKGWQTKRLGDLIELISGQHIDSKDYNTSGRGVGYLTGPSDFGPIYPIVTKWTEHPKIKAKKNDILITVKGSGVGKVNLMDADEVAISRQLMAIRVVNAERQFVYLLLESVFDHFQEESTGAAIPGISREQVLGLQIPVPPLSEQRRIVGLLDEAFGGLATAQAHAAQNLQNARDLFESHLNAVFTNRGNDQVEKRLKEFVDNISTGPFGSLLHKSDYEVGGVPLVNPINIVDSKVVPDERKAVGKATAKRLSRYALQEDDIVIGRRGEIGRCAVISADQAGWLCGTGSFFIRPSNQMDPQFLGHLLRSQHYRKQLEQLSERATMPSISNSDLANLVIAVPAVQRQKRIVSLLDDFVEETQRLESIYQHKLAAIDELKKSLLHQAFSGEL